jgi:polyhydroxybutyrate depolymerase
MDNLPFAPNTTIIAGVWLGSPLEQVAGSRHTITIRWVALSQERAAERRSIAMRILARAPEPVASPERSVSLKKSIVPLSLPTTVVVLVVLLSFPVPDRVGSGSRSGGGCGAAPPAVPGETAALSMLVDGLQREYRLHLPADYDQNTATSLVLAFHWYGGNAHNMESATWWSRHAEEHGYIAVYPQSTSFESRSGAITSWNDLSCSASSGPEGPTCSESRMGPTPPECGERRDCVWCTCHDDVAFADQLLDELEHTLCIDLDRIYATGISNGAMFAHRLGCDMGDRFAAVAPVAGTLAKGFNCAPGSSTSTSIMQLYADHDGLVPADGSEGTGGHFFVPVADVMDAWAAPTSQGCDDIETAYPTSMDGMRGLECTQRANCATGAEVVSCSWAGDHSSASGIHVPFGNDVIWQFFSKNSKQR